MRINFPENPSSQWIYNNHKNAVFLQNVFSTKNFHACRKKTVCASSVCFHTENFKSGTRVIRGKSEKNWFKNLIWYQACSHPVFTGNLVQIFSSTPILGSESTNTSKTLITHPIITRLNIKTFILLQYLVNAIFLNMVP